MSLMRAHCNLQALLAYWSGQEDVVVGVPSHGRTQVGLESAIGSYANVMPLHTNVLKCATFAQLVTVVSQHMREATAHALFPLGEVVRRLDLQRDSSRHDVFQVTVTPQVDTPSNLRLAGLKVSGLDTNQVLPCCLALLPDLLSGMPVPAAPLCNTAKLWAASYICDCQPRHSLTSWQPGPESGRVLRLDFAR